ncbi:MAG: DUF4159 domain-containing protein [Pseudomonadota bacterium]
MFGLGSIGFVAPAVLFGLIALPVLWWLLRAIPPSPRTEVFPGVRLLLGLEDPEREAERTPWWLLLLRVLAIAAVIIGFAQPLLNPSERLASRGGGPVLVLLDAGWASAPDWAERRAAAGAVIDEAGRDGRPVILWRATVDTLAAPGPMAASEARAALDAMRPEALRPDRAAVLALLESAEATTPGETLWLHDGLGHDGEASTALAERLAEFGPLTLIGPAAPARAVLPPRLDEGVLTADVIRTGATGGIGADGAATTVSLAAMASAEGGGERRIAVASADFAPGEAVAAARFDLPAELIATISRITLTDGVSPGGTALADAAVRRVPVAVVDPSSVGEVAPLTSARHYLMQALEPYSEARALTLDAAIERAPSAIFLADYGTIDGNDREGLQAFVEAGGLLVRFAGPRLAGALAANTLASQSVAGADPLLPVRLRRGGRTLGGALAWGDPRTLGSFAPEGPFRRLTPPDEVDVRTQVLADPSPDLADKVWAVLDDGTPFVTSAPLGEGRIVLFHVSADAEWSSLPLSGLFVDMLRELLTLAPGQGALTPDADELDGTLWRLSQTLAPDGTLVPVQANRDPVAGPELAGGRAGDGLLPGLYLRADSGQRAAGAAEDIVMNLHIAGDRLDPFPPAPSGALVDRLAGAESVDLAAPLLLLAVLLAAIDAIATLWVAGRLPRLTRQPGAPAPLALALAAGLSAALAIGSGSDAFAQNTGEGETRERIAEREVSAAAETTLGWLRTGDAQLDEKSSRAMLGLGQALTARTAVEPGPPLGLDAERDEMALVPVIYMPLTARSVPSDGALSRLAQYIENGGLLLIDTQGGAAGAGSADAVAMRSIARALNLPPLAEVDDTHVLTRTFYLLDRFPGRFRGGRVWAEAPPEGRRDVDDEAGLPQFDRVDDNVSPVVVGTADWAAAWAVDDRGRPLFPVGRAGDRQREMAIRFGVNLVLYALTGNYKSDQVHAPAVLERLGQ